MDRMGMNMIFGHAFLWHDLPIVVMHRNLTSYSREIDMTQHVAHYTTCILVIL